ncbi:MAG: hypothetical protein IJT73_07155 [Selenomonadaceae bacterium]|nr:hypothetical protein [Selenomonadaceae bacterium]
MGIFDSVQYTPQEIAKMKMDAEQAMLNVQNLNLGLNVAQKLPPQTRIRR